MKTILITGVNGFLGSHLAKRLTSNYIIIGLEYTLHNLFRIKDSLFKIYATSCPDWVELFEENTVNIIIHTATSYGRNNEEV